MADHIPHPHLEEFLTFYYEYWPSIDESIDKTESFELFGDSHQEIISAEVNSTI